ncbi:hypothetical protein acdb102_46770 [Acidothermaceae bacterium B102]|nr:hypothetical protein acdb102_46770 [Acidothermaceae bacterium B102]
MIPQGWYQDPFDLHELRWFSAGWPTDLVRDGGVEAHDAAPAKDYEGPLLPPTDTAVNGEDLLHSDDPFTRPYNARRARRAVRDDPFLFPFT